MTFEFEDNNIILLLFATCILSLLWPLLVKAKSRLHLLGMIINNFISFGIILLIAKIYLNESALKVSLLNFNEINLFLSVSSLGLIFGLLLTFLWPFAYAYSWSYLRLSGDKQMERFLFFINLSITAALFISLAGNLITLFIFYEVLTLATLPLIAHSYTSHVNKALKKYVFYLLGTSICLFLPAILLIQKFIGTTDFVEGGLAWKELDTSLTITIFGLCLFGLAKTAIFPVHKWLPAAMVANYPVSAILHAVAVVKAGIYCLFKIITEIFGVEFLKVSLVNFPYFKYLAAFSVLVASLQAVRQENIKRILAYSTISQLNIIIMTALILTPSAIQTAVSHMLVHSFAKITLFFAFGYIYLKTSASNLSDLKGMISKFPLICTSIFISGAILIGLPIFASSFSKKLIILEALENEQFVILGVIVLASILSFIYMSKIALAFTAEGNSLKITRSNSYIVKFVISAVAGFSITSYWLIQKLAILIEKV